MLTKRYSSLYLVLVLFLIFILQKIFPVFTEIFKLTTSDVLTHPYTIITSIFLHGSITHLLANLFALGLFGTILEHKIKTKRFLIIFFTAGIIASLFSIPFYHASLGASGAIFGAIGALAIIHPKMVVWAHGFPMPMIFAAIIWIGLDVLGIFVPSNIANMAHLSGVAVGIIFGFFYRSKIKIIKRKNNIILDEKVMQSWEDKYMKK